MAHIDDAFKAFCITYDRLWMPNVKGGICSVGMYSPGASSSPPGPYIKVSASIKEVLDMIQDEFMEVPVVKNLVK